MHIEVRRTGDAQVGLARSVHDAQRVQLGDKRRCGVEERAEVRLSELAVGKGGVSGLAVVNGVSPSRLRRV